MLSGGGEQSISTPQSSVGQQGVNTANPTQVKIDQTHPYVRTNYSQEEFAKAGSQINNQSATTGMSCMLCQHALVMSFKRSSYAQNSYLELRCPESSGCPISDTTWDSCNRAVIYNWYDSFVPEEEELSALYLHWKDFWYLERMPTGVPFTWWDEGRPRDNATGPMNAGWERFGYRLSEDQNAANPCSTILPRATDANYMCYPELKATTNALNPYFMKMDGSGRDPEGTPLSAYDTYLESAYNGHCKDYPNIERTAPEFSNIESGLVSNGSSVIYEGYSCANPEGSIGSRGFSSWQCYMMQENPELRTLADVVSFGDGRKLFPAPTAQNVYGDLYSTMIGTMYRVRLWVRADKIGMNTSPDTNPEGRVFSYPCVAGSLADGVVPDGDDTCCVPFGPCIDGVSKEDCEQVYYGASNRIDLCSGNNWMSNRECCECREGFDENDGCDQIEQDLEGNITRYYTGDYDCFAKNVITVGCNERCVYDPTDKPKIPASSYGKVTAFHPPIMNRLIHGDDPSDVQLSKCQKQHSGPWGMLYTCSGVPVFSYELDDLVEEGLLAAGDAGIIKNYWKTGATPEEECTDIGFAVERLGDTGRFNAKDWREDQVADLTTLETEFRRLAQTYSADVDDSFLNYELPDEIKTYVKDNELLPARKTGQSMLHAYINQSIGKESVREGSSYRPYNLSGEMSDYQIPFGKDDVSLDIQKYDPWHPKYLGPPDTEETELFPGFIERPSIPLNFSWGTFEFKYPIQEMYDGYFGEGVYTISEAEKKFFEAWYSNIPIYFHATPGGWAWTGTGLGPVYRKITEFQSEDSCGWDNNPLGVLDLTDLKTFYQLDINTRTGQGCQPNPTTVNEYSTQCCAGCVIDDSGGGGGGGGGPGLLGGSPGEYDHRGLESSCPQFDPFPNNVRVAATSNASLEVFPTLDHQARIGYGSIRCKTLSQPCFGCSYGGSLECPDLGNEGCGSGDGIDCCSAATPCVQHGPGTRVETECGCQTPSVVGISCCTNFQPYGNRRLGIARRGFRKNADSIDSSNVPGHSAYNESETNTTLRRAGFDICTPGISCTPGGDSCGDDCICCCNDCDDPTNCTCQSPSNCDAAPECVPPWDSVCCDTDGVCCQGGNCNDGIPREQCESEGGTWKEGVESCSRDTCSDLQEGSCCPVCTHGMDDCIQTTREGCIGKYGAIHDQACCDEGTDCNCDPKNPDDPCPECCGAIWTANGTCPDPPDPGEVGPPPRGVATGCLKNPWLCCEPDGGCSIKDYYECVNNGGEAIQQVEDGDFPDGDACDICTRGHCCIVYQDSVHCIENVTETQCELQAGDNDFNFNPDTTSCQDGCGSDGGGGGGQDCCDDGPNNSCGEDEFCQQSPSECYCAPKPSGACDLLTNIGFQQGCLGNQSRMFDHVATRWRPRPENPATPLKEECWMGQHDVLDSCVRRHYQSTKNAFRISSFVTMSDTDPYGQNNSGACPGMWGGSTEGEGGYQLAACCCPSCSAFWNRRPGTGNACTGDLATTNTVRTIHTPKQEFTVTVYPFRLRCAQILDINGYQRCGLLTQEIEITDPLYISRLPKLLIGAVDPLSCNTIWRSGGGSVTERQYTCMVQDRCAESEKDGDPSPCCVYESEVTTSIYGVCIPEDLDGDGVDDGCDPDDSLEPDVRAVTNPDHINDAGYCQDLSRESLFVGYSYQVPGSGKFLYTPDNGGGYLGGVPGIPKWSCPRSILRSERELERPGRIPDDTVLRTCAEFFNDKELSKINPPVITDPESNTVDFKFYGGVRDSETTPTGYSAEYVDIDTLNPAWNSLWLKQEYPSITNIRLFGIGDYNIEGGFGGGMSEDRTDLEGITRGLFAGTMVIEFEDEADFRYFDGQVGHHNIKLTIGPDGVPGFDSAVNKAGCEYIGRPMRNPFYTSPNPPDWVGYINGRGLTYAKARDGFNKPQVGKVYEFCAEEAGAVDQCGIKPIGDLDGPGQKGIVGFISEDPFTVYLDRMGISDGNFDGCQ